MGSLGKVNPEQHVILFDGLCNLCNWWVQFVIKHDKKCRFQFASLQSAFGQRQLRKFGLDLNRFHSIVLIQNSGMFQQSDAALEIARSLDGGWRLLYGLKIVPRFFRDFVYRMIANNRYRLFGKKEVCWIPTRELSSRFIE